jgi:uncharacterized membrane protein YoaK (UPF0700 family)
MSEQTLTIEQIRNVLLSAVTAGYIDANQYAQLAGLFIAAEMEKTLLFGNRGLDEFKEMKEHYRE